MTEAPEAAQPAPEAKSGTSLPKRITVFGGSGFIGRRLVQRLVEGGATVRIADRQPDRARQRLPRDVADGLETAVADIRDQVTVDAAVSGADAVINLVGILYEKGPQTFTAIHTEGAGRVADAAARASVGRLVQMSALGADPDAAAAYARSKAAGEAAVQRVVAAATIVRPSIVFGREDDFFNKFAGMAAVSPALPLIGGGRTRFQPVFVDDVAEAFARILTDPATAGKTYELGGPQVYTFRELLELLLKQMRIRRLLMPLPFPIAEAEAFFLEKLPKPPLTRDQLALLRSDNVVSGRLPTLQDLGITPTPLETVLPTYIR
ncbi:MAG: complex I NDUFA9 subunit family protein [Rhodospirillales bacterium]|nr:MAG: complex I NDUFA9 subunit family protein [Rhodospirillales bacterium]